MVNIENLKSGDVLLCNKDILKDKQLIFKKGQSYVMYNKYYIEGRNSFYWVFDNDWKDYFELIESNNVDDVNSIIEESQYVKEFRDLQDKCFNIFKKKNSDYGNSFEESLNEEGIVAARIRMRDKWNRFKSLSKNNDIKVKGESLQDTLLDLANYAILTVMWLNKNKE